jgi:hypothetical protein
MSFVKIRGERLLNPKLFDICVVVTVQRFRVQRFRGWRAMNTGRFEDIGGMAFFPEVSSPGLWPGKEDGVCSRLRVEGADSSRHNMAEDDV